MTLSCKHVDDVVIGAPYLITEDLIKSLNIKKVISFVDTLEDKPLDKFNDIDQF
jgi:glycerol-3-phosphate cytidylyltransferase-like family protein